MRLPLFLVAVSHVSCVRIRYHHHLGTEGDTSKAAGESDIHLHLGLGRAALGLVVPGLLKNNQELLPVERKRVILLNRFSSFYEKALDLSVQLNSADQRSTTLWQHKLEGPLRRAADPRHLAGQIALGCNGAPYAHSVQVIRTLKGLEEWLAPQNSTSDTALVLLDMKQPVEEDVQMLLRILPAAHEWSTAWGSLGLTGFVDLLGEAVKLLQGEKGRDLSVRHQREALWIALKQASVFAFENDHNDVKQFFAGLADVRRKLQPGENLVADAIIPGKREKAFLDRVCTERKWTILPEARGYPIGRDNILMLDVFTEAFRGGAVVPLDGQTSQTPAEHKKTSISLVVRTLPSLAHGSRDDFFIELAKRLVVPPQDGTVSAVERGMFELQSHLKLNMVNGMQTVMALYTLEKSLTNLNLRGEGAFAILGCDEDMESNDRLTMAYGNLSLLSPDFISATNKETRSLTPDFRKQLFSWWAGRILLLLWEAKELLDKNICSYGAHINIYGSHECWKGIATAMWEYVHTTEARLTQMAEVDKLGRILRGGVRNRFSSRVKLAASQMLTRFEQDFHKDTQLVEITDAVLEMGPQDFTHGEGSHRKDNAATHRIMKAIQSNTLKFESLLSQQERSCRTHSQRNRDFQSQFFKKKVPRLASLGYVTTFVQWRANAVGEWSSVAEAPGRIGSSIQSFFHDQESHINVLASLKQEYADQFVDKESLMWQQSHEVGIGASHSSKPSQLVASPSFRAMRGKIQRTFQRLLELKTLNFGTPSYLEIVGAVPYPHAFLIAQGSWSPYHKGHAVLANKGRQHIICQHYWAVHGGVEPVLLQSGIQQNRSVQKAQLECNPDTSNVFGILGFSRDIDVLMKGSERQHLLIGERVRQFEKVAATKQGAVSWLVHDASNEFGVAFDSESRNSAEFALHSEVMDIVFLIAMSFKLEDESSITKADLLEELKKDFPNAFARDEMLRRDPRYKDHLGAFRFGHISLDPENKCDDNLTCLRSYLRVFEDLSDKRWIHENIGYDHFRNRVAAISTNSEKRIVAEEKLVYRDAGPLVPREPADLSSTTVRRLMTKGLDTSDDLDASDVTSAAAKLHDYVHPSTLDYLHRLATFFDEAIARKDVLRAYFEYNAHALGRGSSSLEARDLYSFVAHGVSRPIEFRANHDILGRAVHDSANGGVCPLSRRMILSEQDKIGSGTKSEVFVIELRRLLNYLSEDEDNQIPEQMHSQSLGMKVVLKFARDKAAGHRCGFTANGSICDKRWNHILLHEKQTSDKIHTLPLTQIERSRLQNAVNKGKLPEPMVLQQFADGLDEFVSRSFSKIIYYGHISFLLRAPSEGSAPYGRCNAEVHASGYIGHDDSNGGESSHTVVEFLTVVTRTHQKLKDAGPAQADEILEGYSLFLVHFLEKSLRAMSYMHEVKKMVHMDMHERTLLVKENRPHVLDRIPWSGSGSDFEIGVIEYGLAENFELFGEDVSDANTPRHLPDLHPTHPFSWTGGSGRLPLSLQQLEDDPFEALKQHDLSIIAARLMEVSLFGNRRQELKNWKWDSSSSSWKTFSANRDKQAHGGMPPNLASALRAFPTSDSLFKDVLMRTDARHILRNKILWRYTLRSDIAVDGLADVSETLHDLVQDCAPLLNRITTRSHPWFEDELLEKIEMVISLVDKIEQQRPSFVENWLMSFYVDAGGTGKVTQLGGHPRAIDLYASLLQREPIEEALSDSTPSDASWLDKPLTQQFRSALHEFVMNLKKDLGRTKEQMELNLLGEVCNIRKDTDDIEEVLASIKVEDLNLGAMSTSGTNPTDQSLIEEIRFLIQTSFLYPLYPSHQSFTTATSESGDDANTRLHIEHIPGNSSEDAKKVARLEADLLFYHKGSLGSSPTMYAGAVWGYCSKTARLSGRRITPVHEYYDPLPLLPPELTYVKESDDKSNVDIKRLNRLRLRYATHLTRLQHFALNLLQQHERRHELHAQTFQFRTMVVSGKADSHMIVSPSNTVRPASSLPAIVSVSQEEIPICSVLTREDYNVELTRAGLPMGFHVPLPRSSQYTPHLVVLVGPPGGGKSSLLSRHPHIRRQIFDFPEAYTESDSQYYSRFDPDSMRLASPTYRSYLNGKFWHGLDRQNSGRWVQHDFVYELATGRVGATADETVLGLDKEGYMLAEGDDARFLSTTNLLSEPVTLCKKVASSFNSFSNGDAEESFLSQALRQRTNVVLETTGRTGFLRDRSTIIQAFEEAGYAITIVGLRVSPQNGQATNGAAVKFLVERVNSRANKTGRFTSPEFVEDVHQKLYNDTSAGRATGLPAWVTNSYLTTAAETWWGTGEGYGHTQGVRLMYVETSATYSGPAVSFKPTVQASVKNLAEFQALHSTYRKILVLLDLNLSQNSGLPSTLISELSRRYVRRADAVVRNIDLSLERSAGRELANGGDYLFTVIVIDKGRNHSVISETFSDRSPSGAEQFFFLYLDDLQPSIFSQSEHKRDLALVDHLINTVINTALPEFAVLPDSQRGKYAGYFSKSELQPPIPWQSSLLPADDKSILISKNLPRKKKTVIKETIVGQSGKVSDDHAPIDVKPAGVHAVSWPGPVELLLMGDSHVEYGYDYGKRGLANGLRNAFNSTYVDVRNRGASGYNSRQALTYIWPVVQREHFASGQRLDAETKPVLWISLLMFGSIDAYIPGSIKDSMAVPVDEYFNNMKTLAEGLIDQQHMHRDRNLILLLSPPAPMDKLMESSWLSTYDTEYKKEYKFRTKEHTSFYAAQTEAVAKSLRSEITERRSNASLHVEYFDTYAWSLGLAEGDYKADGLHFNAQGNQKLVNQIVELLRSTL